MSLGTYVLLSNQYNPQSDALADYRAYLASCCYWPSRENAEFITCNQLQVEVDFAVFLGFSSDREMVGSMQSCSYSQRLTSIELLYAELRRGPIMTTDEKPRAAQTAEGIMSLVLGKPVVVHNWRNCCEWGAFPTHSA